MQQRLISPVWKCYVELNIRNVERVKLQLGYADICPLSDV
jgi:hypothetical protein